MLGKPDSTAEESQRSSLSTSFAPPNPQPYPALHEPTLSPANLNSRPWLPRLAQWIKALIGEPPNTTLPDWTQENP